MGVEKDRYMFLESSACVDILKNILKYIRKLNPKTFTISEVYSIL